MLFLHPETIRRYPSFIHNNRSVLLSLHQQSSNRQWYMYEQPSVLYAKVASWSRIYYYNPEWPLCCSLVLHHTAALSIQPAVFNQLSIHNPTQVQWNTSRYWQFSLIFYFNGCSYKYSQQKSEQSHTDYAFKRFPEHCYHSKWLSIMDSHVCHRSAHSIKEQCASNKAH